MADWIEHFVYGPATGLNSLHAALPEGIEVVAVTGGLCLREILDRDLTVQAAVARMMARAAEHGLDYDGHGQALEQETGDGDGGQDLDIHARTFTQRTGIKAGHSFAFPVPGERYGHAIYLGSNRLGYVMLDISALVSHFPASADAVRDAPRRYRQPVLVWHTAFPVVAAGSAKPVAPLPCEVLLRCGVGWPDPDEIAGVERRLGLPSSATPEGWTGLMAALAGRGERLPGVEGHCLWTARAGRSGALTLVEDHAVICYADGALVPMPWQPATMDEVGAALAGGVDAIALRDRVT